MLWLVPVVAGSPAAKAAPDAAPGTTHDGFTSTGRCYDLAAAKVDLSFLHVTTSLFPLAQTCVLLVSAAVLFARLTSAYKAAFRKTHGTLHQRLLDSRTPASSVVIHEPQSPASLAPASGGAPRSGATAASGNSTASRVSVASGRSAWRGGWLARWWRRRWGRGRGGGDETKRMVLPIYYS